MKEKLIVIVGPTAVGKTALSIELAKRYAGEIISGDSMQVYKGMDIGTAKVTEAEQQGITHHLIDIKDPTEAFSVAEFQELVLPLITKLNEEGKVPILVGGTGLYVNAITKQYQLEALPTDETYRSELEQLVETKGKIEVHNQLKLVDPESADKIHPNNIRRVIRALEVTRATGIAFSKQPKQEETQSPYDLAFVGLTMSREQLYERINLRVDLMVKQGLLDEVRALYEREVRDCQSVQAIGYKELYGYFDGSVSLEEAIDSLKQNSRRYAKRQLTWFRNKTDAAWFDTSKGLDSHLFTEICSFIEGEITSIAN
ncbi:tRNA (adenosine(37)-N6)-dimethylallyltransferase MiaA [Bacillus suaedae]|nr:tRNA (adenosine(37)-N6)-dimethylallyltransferase MiaA [Bacillus suaedae]